MWIAPISIQYKQSTLGENVRSEAMCIFSDTKTLMPFSAQSALAEKCKEQSDEHFYATKQT